MRKIKGLEFFPLKCNNSLEMDLIEAKFGLVGFAIYVKLLQKIYGKEGYYLKVDEDTIAILRRELGLKDKKLISNIISECIKKSVFDAKIYKKYKVLTSADIQEDYFIAVKRRKSNEVINDYLCESIKNKYVLDASFNNECLHNVDNLSTLGVIREDNKIKDNKIDNKKIYDNIKNERDAILQLPTTMFTESANQLNECVIDGFSDNEVVVSENGCEATLVETDSNSVDLKLIETNSNLIIVNSDKGNADCTSNNSDERQEVNQINDAIDIDNAFKESEICNNENNKVVSISNGSETNLNGCETGMDYATTNQCGGERLITRQEYKRFSKECGNRGLQLSDKVPQDFDVELLITSIKESQFLQKATNLTFKWFIRRYDYIVGGRYRDFVKNLDAESARDFGNMLKNIKPAN